MEAGNGNGKTVLERVTEAIDSAIVSIPRDEDPDPRPMLRPVVRLASRGISDDILRLVVDRYQYWHGECGGAILDTGAIDGASPTGVTLDLRMNSVTPTGCVLLMGLADRCPTLVDVSLTGNRVDFATSAAVLAVFRANSERRRETERRRERVRALAVRCMRASHSARASGDIISSVSDRGPGEGRRRHWPAPAAMAAVADALLDASAMPREIAFARAFAAYHSQPFVSDP